jgi:hypothetical protein
MSLIALNNPGKRPRKAQGVAEYSIFVAAIILGLVVMGTYIKRGLSGRYAEVVNATLDSANTSQYEPYYQKLRNSIQVDKKVKQDIKQKGEITSNFTETDNFTVVSDSVLFGGNNTTE